MKKYLLAAIIVFLLTLGACSIDNEKKEISYSSSISDSLMRITDSLRSRDYLHNNFYGVHKHGQDLAKHAHQNIPKKIKIRKKGLAVKARKIEAYNKSNERRKKRIKEYMKRKTQKESE